MLLKYFHFLIYNFQKLSYKNLYHKIRSSLKTSELTCKAFLNKDVGEFINYHVNVNNITCIKTAMSPDISKLLVGIYSS